MSPLGHGRERRAGRSRSAGPRRPRRRHTRHPLSPDNLRARVLKPVYEEVGASWAGFHSLRHTYASLQLAAGRNLLQLSRALGHHSRAFTLETYCHLLDDVLLPR